MRYLINKWRYYGLGKDEYKKCMEIIFIKNIISIRKTNAVVAAILAFFIIVPFIINKDTSKTLSFIITSGIAALIYILVRLKFRHVVYDMKINKIIIYILIFLTYANIITFGIYLGVWANPGKIDGSFLAILICALTLFIIPPIFHHFLTALSMSTFIIIVLIVKNPSEYNIDIPNTLFAGINSIIFGWQIIMNRLSLVSIANRMEGERNNYYDQITIDELTQLKNRRDFMNTFQRFLVSPRQSDNFMCIAILDIDFFKNYNDYYGHPEGDECLRKIGRALKNIHDNRSIYAARIGGEEFALVWFEKEASGAQEIALLLCTTIRGLNIPHKKSSVSSIVTISVGIYVIRCGTQHKINTLYNLADKALYIAKENGRNRAIITSSDPLRITPLCEII